MRNDRTAFLFPQFRQRGEDRPGLASVAQRCQMLPPRCVGPYHRDFCVSEIHCVCLVASSSSPQAAGEERSFSQPLRGWSRFTSAEVQAGGGPENIFSSSTAALVVANGGQSLRAAAEDTGTQRVLSRLAGRQRVDRRRNFRTKFLTPILTEIERRDIGDHIDNVVYSTDFPWAVDCAEDEGQQVPQYLTPTASLNGLTFLYQDVMARKLDFLALDANKYFSPAPSAATAGVARLPSWYGWGKDARS